MIVDQSKYTREYYTGDCEGYTVDGMPGERLLSLLKYVPEEATTILDIGCGRGEVAKYFNDKYVLSIDYSMAAMQIFYENNNFFKTFVRHDIVTGLRWIKKNHFDVVILADVIEHIDHEHLLNIVNDITESLKNGGIILIDTPITSRSCRSELHINLYESIDDVCNLFKNTEAEMIATEWYKKPEHCHIILRRNL